jgi:hypothetical protein
LPSVFCFFFGQCKKEGTENTDKTKQFALIIKAKQLIKNELLQMIGTAGCGLRLTCATDTP